MGAKVVLYRFSTSNHNPGLLGDILFKLYYIVSLHQTTTISLSCSLFVGCIISFLYIKPQRVAVCLARCVVVLYRFSTSNHNHTPNYNTPSMLYYIVSLHQTTTTTICLLRYKKLYYIVSLHQTTTVLTDNYVTFWLYYIVSLHQTTTTTTYSIKTYRCIISFLYIKPQLYTPFCI